MGLLSTCSDAPWLASMRSSSGFSTDSCERTQPPFPNGPSDLVAWVDEKSESEAVGLKTGRYAGPLTRFLAVLLDSFVVTTAFTLLVAGSVFVIQLVAPQFEPEAGGLWYVVAFVAWAIVYKWFGLAIFGKTIGKWTLGLRVVRATGSPAIYGRSAFVRTITYPLSFVVFGLGLLGVVFGQERRAWHDHFAGTAVVYDWGSRTAAMPTPLANFLERRGAA